MGVVTSSSKDDADVIGLDGLESVCRSVNAKNAASTVEAGVSGIAVISAIFSHSNVRAATRELRAVVDDACAKRCTEQDRA